MGKKNMDLLLSNIMGNAEIKPSDKVANPAAPETLKPETGAPHRHEEANDAPWKHFSFICSVELADKVQAIAHKENFTIRALMEFMMRQGIESYEAKYGKVKKIKSKDVHDVM